MKVRPEMKSIEEDMQPGRLSLEGYLGKDTRSLETIIREDEEILKELGTTAKEMGRVMRRITLAGMEAEGEPIPFDGYEVEVSEYRGWIGCPFKDNRKAGKRITNVTSLETGEHFCWTDIGIHLVRDHGFFQGKGSSFRLDPAALAKFLRMSERTLPPLKEEE